MSDSSWSLDCSPPGSSVHGIHQARIMEWVAFSFSSASSWSKEQRQVSNQHCRHILYHLNHEGSPFPLLNLSILLLFFKTNVACLWKLFYHLSQCWIIVLLLSSYASWNISWFCCQVKRSHDWQPCQFNCIPQFSSVQFSLSVVSDSLRPYESQHARPPCPSPTPGVYSNSCPLSQWCHPATSSSVVPFSSFPQSLPESGSFPMSQLFVWGGQSTGVSASASVLPMNTQDWSPLGWTGWISLQSTGLSTVIFNTTVQKHQFFGAQLSL